MVDGGFPLFYVFAAVVLVGIAVVLLYAVVETVRNLRSPVIDWPARVVGKRRDDSTSTDGTTSTSYYVTFENGAGQRREFSVNGHDFQRIADGEVGVARTRGSWFLGFSRQR